MKQHLKPGFSIIELIIGFMISAILLTTCLTIYNQISKSCNKIQSLTSQDLAIIILQKRLSNDLLGLCPLFFTQEDSKEKPKSKNNEQKNPTIKENNYFYAQTHDEQLDFMTFISTNTLQAYPVPEHYIARIVYLLKQDANNKNFFILQRKEETQISNEFNPEKIKEGKFYTIVEHIKKCKLEYGFVENSENTKAKKSPKSWDIKWVQQWSQKEEQEKQEKEDGQEKTPKLPDIIRITITLQEFTYKPETQHVFYCIIPQSKNISIKSIAKKRNEKAAAAQQTNISNAHGIIQRVEGAAKEAKGNAHA